ncbi:hypothetical protein NP233_g3132 [Leucocoprinus birnbaumii]|uniref:Uncharacterized protein n=1 Tax=Leucocoprinus birnbaumii TaxID=56174 RepID=A0AAD5W0W2_9AGAR|nr:hypothetical protein NP233_g3132 [Leucocoprinus birnbaumii]
MPVEVQTTALKMTQPTLNIPDAMCLPEPDTMSSLVVVGNSVVLMIDAITTFLVIWAKRRNYSENAPNKLLQKVYRDSIAYFSLNCAAAIGAIILCVKVPSLAVMTSRITSALASIVLSRMIIGLKEAGSSGCTVDQVSLLTSLRFAQGNKGCELIPLSTLALELRSTVRTPDLENYDHAS